MRTIDNDALAAIVFELGWRSRGARHTERFMGARVNFWRDLIPESLRRLLHGRGPGDRTELLVAPGDLVPDHAEALILELPRKRFDARVPGGRDAVLRLGRFYPRGRVRGLPGVYPQDLRPFRCIKLTKTHFTADLNHPLAGRELTLAAEVREVREKKTDVGGTCHDWFECVSQGVGLSARPDEGRTDFFADEPFSRPDEASDAAFYRSPRLVNHVDSAASANIASFYAAALSAPGSEPLRVLDLMAGHASHLPASLDVRLTGLGMNREEMDANPALESRLVHDLNERPDLPFADGAFDAAICSLSVEYLTRPREVFAEAARVLAPGGVFAVNFSQRWFPPKCVRIWTELHEFERVGLVTEYFLDAARFTDVETVSFRGWPRPWDPEDRYLDRLAGSDPVFGVTGRVPAD